MDNILDQLKKLSIELPGDFRLSIAKRTSKNFTARRLNEHDRQVAEAIFRQLAQDVEVQIRQALVENLKHDPMLPKDVAKTLANDVAEVSVPLLESTPVLSDDELVEIIHSTRDVAKQLAVARREKISAPLGMALVETNRLEVVSELAGNRGAELNDALVLEVAERFKTHGILITSLLDRHTLSLGTAEKVLNVVSDQLKRQLSTHLKLSPYKLEDAMQSSEEWMRIHMMQHATPEELMQFASQLHLKGKLTASLVFKSLCYGYVRFFEAAMAVRANVTVKNARRLMLDPGPLGFRAMYKAADMPVGFCEALKALLLVAWEVTDRGRHIPNQIGPRLLEGIMSARYHETVENMSFLMALVGRNMPVRPKGEGLVFA